MTVLIPAFEPDTRLLELVDSIHRQSDYSVVIVDDGSGPFYASLFEQARERGCTVLVHESNRGKGCALKTGFRHIADAKAEKTGVVTADADGQHTLLDIMRVAEEVPLASGRIVLGARRFVAKVPFRSIVGNGFMRVLFTAASGKPIADTQTGLRGIPIALLPPLLGIRGERFEYEMNMLLEAGNIGYSFKQVPIDTIYEKGNRSSHFRVISDSVRVCVPFFKFCLSGIVSAVLDYVLLFVFQYLTGSLFFGVVLARAASSGVNYTMNRALVFHSHMGAAKPYSHAAGYYILVCVMLVFNYLLLLFFTDVLHIWLAVGKILTECTLFFVSYTMQRFFIFRRKVLT